MQQMWRQIGVKLKIEQVEFPTRLSRSKATTSRCAGFSWTDDMADPSEATVYLCLSETNDALHSGWTDDKANELFLASQKEPDPARRAGRTRRSEGSTAPRRSSISTRGRMSLASGRPSKDSCSSRSATPSRRRRHSGVSRLRRPGRAVLHSGVEGGRGSGTGRRLGVSAAVCRPQRGGMRGEGHGTPAAVQQARTPSPHRTSAIKNDDYRALSLKEAKPMGRDARFHRRHVFRAATASAPTTILISNPAKIRWFAPCVARPTPFRRENAGH